MTITGIQCATSLHPVHQIWRMRHRLATPGLRGGCVTVICQYHAYIAVPCLLRSYFSSNGTTEELFFYASFLIVFKK